MQNFGTETQRLIQKAFALVLSHTLNFKQAELTCANIKINIVKYEEQNAATVFNCDYSQLNSIKPILNVNNYKYF